MEDLTGKQFGSYQLIGPLGEGGMAAVYKAYQASMDRYVALKVLPRSLANDPEFVSRFRREAKLLAKLQHPHILPVFDYGEAEGYTYIVMPFVQSGTLMRLLEGKPLPLKDICQVISQVGDALNYAHSQGLVHRDVKPSNILIDQGGNCLLTDFGLARMVDTSVDFTTAGTILGTPAYMSPEQGSGGKADARSDIYSLGIILYEMATGRVPFRAETPVAVIYKHVQDPLPPARKINPELPEAVERVILKSLSKNPEDRFQQAAEMVQALLSAASEEAGPREAPGAGEKAPESQTTILAGSGQQLQPTLVSRDKPGMPRLVWMALGGLLVLLVMGGGYWGLSAWFKDRAPAVQAVLPSSTVTAQLTLPKPTTAVSAPKPVIATQTIRAVPTPTQTTPELVTATGVLLAGEQLVSVNARYVFRFQTDGDLQVFDKVAAEILWSSHTSGTEPWHLVMQDDGNLVLYDRSDEPLWASETNGSQGDYFLVMQDDGNLVIYRGIPYQGDHVPVWATGTAG